MALDPTKHPDWQIAQDAEKSMKTVETLAAELGLEKDELLPYGHYMGKIEQQAVLRRLADRPNGKYVDVTARRPRWAKASPPLPSVWCRASPSVVSKPRRPSASLRAAPPWA